MSDTILSISGVLATGVGQATGFTQLDWARAAFIEKLSMDPHPGTVNLIVVEDECRAAWRRLRNSPAIVIHPPRTDWCDAKCYKARIVPVEGAAVPAAIVLPDVTGYADNQIELIAPVAVRATFGLADGDTVRIEVMLKEAESASD